MNDTKPIGHAYAYADRSQLQRFDLKRKGKSHVTVPRCAERYDEKKKNSYILLRSHGGLRTLVAT